MLRSGTFSFFKFHNCPFNFLDMGTLTPNQAALGYNIRSKKIVLRLCLFVSCSFVIDKNKELKTNLLLSKLCTLESISIFNSFSNLKPLQQQIIIVVYRSNHHLFTRMMKSHSREYIFHLKNTTYTILFHHNEIIKSR